MAWRPRISTATGSTSSCSGQGDPTAGVNGGAGFVFWAPAPGAYVFTDADLAFYAASAGDNFGVGLNAADLDGDGEMELLFGAPYEETGGTGAGSVYVVGF